MDLLAHTARFLEQRFASDTRYLLAVSGGRDSMALLDVFRRLRPGEALIVAHFNHRTRETCERDEAAVEEIAQRHGLEFARAERAEETATSEDALRAARRLFLQRARAAYGASVIVTAHHAQDQLETFLMRVLRGTGLDGLSAMEEFRSPWAKPWLTVPPAAIAEYVAREQIRFHTDESNASDRYLRNRLRARLSPLVTELAEEFGGEEKFFARFSSTLQETREAAASLRAEARRRVDALFVETPFWFRASREGLLAEEPSLRKRLWREVFARAGAPVPARETVERCERALLEGTKAIEVPGLRLRASCGEIFLQSPEQRRHARGSFQFSHEGAAWVCRELGWTVELPEETRDVEVRFARPGDRFGSEKLNKVFLAQRCPQPERALLPVVALRDSSQVLWFYGEKSPAPRSAVRCQGPRFRLTSPARVSDGKPLPT